MKVTAIKPVGRKPVYDLSVNSDDYDEQHYVLENGVVTHNTGSYYSADNIFILGRQQDKDGTELLGYNFIINVEKSRYVREKSKIPISVKFDGGISKWSGLLDMALASGHVIKPSVGWYSKVDTTTGEIDEKKYRIKDTFSKEFWMPILQDKTFQQWVQNNYQIAHGNIISDDSIDEDMEAMPVEVV